jgi:type IV pilus assembly protein PilN
MANINLLPWREAQRRERNRATGVACIAMLLLAGALVFMGKLYMDGRIGHQNDRNNYVQQEIDALSKVIKEIEGLKEKRDALLARIEVIQTLQSNRSQIVHVFDDLVNKLPEGVYFDSINKADKKLRIQGKAQSNARVSALMRRLDASDWFDKASLKVVDVVDQNGALVSKFDVEVKEQRKETAADDGVENIK